MGSAQGNSARAGKFCCSVCLSVCLYLALCIYRMNLFSLCISHRRLPSINELLFITITLRTLPRRMPRGNMKRTKRPSRRRLSEPIRLGTTDTRIPSSFSTTIPIASTSRSQRMPLPRTTLIHLSHISPRHGLQSTPSLSLTATSNVLTTVVSVRMISTTI